MIQLTLVVKDCRICKHCTYERYCCWFPNKPIKYEGEAQDCEKFIPVDYLNPEIVETKV